jgi:hypothetical protein
MLPVWVAGCATSGAAPSYTLVEPHPRVIDTFYTVDPQLTWSSSTSGKVETWTVDGFVLHSLRFFKGIGDGEAMFTVPKKDDRPVFRTAMTPTEVVEFVAESVFGPRVPPRNVRPAPFGGRPGFRFEMDYYTRDGVHRQAIAAGTVLSERLHVIVYDGTSLYHFGKYRAEAEHIMESVKLKE